METLSALKPGSILIAPSWLHPLLRQQLAQAPHGCMGVHLHSMQSFIASWQHEETPSSTTLLFSCRNAIEALLPTLQIYQKAAMSASFIEECIRFIDECKLWNITLQDLPQKQAAHQELYRIVEVLFPLCTSGDHIRSALQDMAQESFSHVYLFDSIQTLEEAKLTQFLVERGAIRMPTVSRRKQHAFFHAVNKRQEIEGCAQYILSSQMRAEDIHIALADPSYAPLLKQIFQRYQIPCTFLTNAHTSIITQRFAALLQLVLDKDQESLLSCIDCGCFALPHPEVLRTYLEIFAADIELPFTHLQQLSQKGHILQQRDIERLRHIEAGAEQERQALLPQVRPLLTEHDTAMLFAHICELIKQTLRDDAPKEARMFLKLQEILEDACPYIQGHEALRFLRTIVQKVTDHSTTTAIKGAVITGLTQGCCERTIQFILGASQQHYPAFTSKKGIFDERYYQLLPYPSMEERYQFHMRQLQMQLDRSAQLIVSYPLGTYEGKAIEAALEMEQLCKVSQPYPLLTCVRPAKAAMQLSTATARELFVKDGVLQGSISALERYVRCPYAYFLRYGLQLQEPMSYGFSNSYIGTLTHYILETLTAQAKKAYTQTDPAKLQQLLQVEIDCIQNVFPAQKEKLAILRQRLEISITQTLQRLQELEEHSHLQPWKQEAAFTIAFPIDASCQLLLKGIIDRIDTDGALAAIIDYKSSAKSLSETKVFAGLQLQLMTYALVVKQMGKELLGAYYLSFKNENITAIAGSMSRRRPITWQPYGKEEKLEALYKAHQLNGWTTSFAIGAMDDDGRHIRGVRSYKNGDIKAGKTYSLATIENAFHDIYRQIGKRIISGDISLSPCEDACMFCAYHEICRFHDLPSERKPLVELDEALYLTRKEEA